MGCQKFLLTCGFGWKVLILVLINPENPLLSLSLGGPLLQLAKFDVSCIKWCTMHVINLGILGNLNGGCMILGASAEHNVFFDLSIEFISPMAQFLISFKIIRISKIEPYNKAG